MVIQPKPREDLYFVFLSQANVAQIGNLVRTHKLTDGSSVNIGPANLKLNMENFWQSYVLKHYGSNIITIPVAVMLPRVNEDFLDWFDANYVQRTRGHDTVTPTLNDKDFTSDKFYQQDRPPVLYNQSWFDAVARNGSKRHAIPRI